MPPNTLGKTNPHYDAETDSVYIPDYMGTLLLRYSLQDNTTKTVSVDGLTTPSYFIPVQDSDDQYVVSVNGSGFVINWDGISDHGQIERELFTISPDVTTDSGYVSSAGELYTGTIDHFCVGSSSQGFYRYTRDNGLELISKHFTSTVGSTIINNTLYHLDGCQQILAAWDIDPETRALSMSCFQ